MTRQQVPNHELGRDTARANLLVNGGFEIWQRGNGPFTTGVCADRWGINKTAGDTFSISVDGAAANIDIRSNFSAAVTYTRSTGGSNVEQNLSGDGLARYRGGALSFSARVKCSTANAVKLRIYADTETASAYHTGGGTYETLTVTKVLGATPANLFISFIFDQSCTAYLDNAMLVLGSVAADYAPLHPADDLARCQRYYQRHDGGGYGFMGPGQALGATSGVYFLPMQGRTAATPTVTFSAPSTFTATNGVGSAMTGATGIMLNPGTNPVTTMCLAVSGMSGLTTGMASWLLSNNTAASVIVEANP